MKNNTLNERNIFGWRRESPFPVEKQNVYQILTAVFNPNLNIMSISRTNAILFLILTSRLIVVMVIDGLSCRWIRADAPCDVRHTQRMSNEFSRTNDKAL